jgi:hypothetical protein
MFLHLEDFLKKVIKMISKFENEIVILTGLSIDKKRLNEAYSEASADKVFAAYLKEIKDKTLPNYFPITINDEVKGNFSGVVADKFKELANGAAFLKAILGESGLTQVVESILTGGTGSLFKFAFAKSYEAIREANKYNVKNESAFWDDFLNKVVNDKTIRPLITESKPVDFFNVYLSNQSDARAVPAFSKLAVQKDRPKLDSHWAYSDRPFYQNEYINYVVVTVESSAFLNESELSDDCRSLIIAQFLLHGIDILASKSLAAFAEKVMTSKEEDSSDSDFVGKITKNFMTNFGNSISERSFFGIDLISRIFLTLFSLKRVESKDDKALNIEISSELNYPDVEFITELVRCAGDPEKTFVFNGSAANHKGQKTDIKISKFEGKASDFKKNNIAGKNKGNISGLFINGNSILVPVKLFMSLPLAIDKATKIPNKVDYRLLLPALVTKDNSTVNVEVLTCGGVEHNRPLMHLINAHRYQQGEKRVFGFLDNQFDFAHRIANHDKDDFKHMFTMGVAQPVSGFNSILVKRSDNEEGASSSLRAKHLAFKIKCPVLNRDISVFSIYGFSALATVLASVKIVADVVEAIGADKQFLLQETINRKKAEKLNLNSGYTWMVDFCKEGQSRMFQTSNDLDPFSIVSSQNKSTMKNALIELFTKNEDDGGVISELRSGAIGQTR